ncbi:hypothetical protein [Streptomyces sp. NBRC 110028]|uniref:hypothetical protein n=1 Tax=Streptomyces sp. NBRC 110028 TaxID=1621260 RepID=UPI0007C832EC|nr:hypothetical protein [Streptomyces sp. NBRC 110028]
MRSERGQDTDTTVTEDNPWWAGMGAAGGSLLVVVGVGLLLWSSVTGNAGGDNWALSYGAGKVLAIGCVVAGAALLGRYRRRMSARRSGSGQERESTTGR